MAAVNPALSEFPCQVIVPEGVPLLDVAGLLRVQVGARLLQTGAVLLRGAQCGGAAELAEFARALSESELFGYAGGASPRRRSGAEGIYNSTDYPPDMPLLLHNELSYSNEFPKRLYFLCDVEPHAGGETTLGDSRRILAEIPEEITRELKTRGVRYIRNLTGEKGSGYSWQEAFETDDREEVEAICARIGAEHCWEAEGALRVSQTGPATLLHPVTGEEVWFNQVAGFYADPGATPENVPPRLECTFADDGPIPTDAVRNIRTVLERRAIPHRWRRGDIVILDNILAAHGRMPYTGERRILLAMA